jgi:hypothetical protein
MDVNLAAEGTGQLDLTSVVSLNRASLFADNGGQVSAPLVTDIMDQNLIRGEFRSQGANALIDLSNVTSFTGRLTGLRTFFSANIGGKIDLSKLTTIPGGAINFESRGADSVIDLSSLTSFTDTSTQDTSRIWAVQGGEILLNSGTVTLVDVDVFQTEGGSLVAGTLSLDQNSLLEFTDTLSASVTNAGIMRYGGPAPVGAATIDGDLTQADSSRTDFLFNSLAEYERFEVTGTAQLAGQVNFALAHGFVPALGDHMEIVSATTLVDGFDYGGLLINPQVFLAPVSAGNKAFALAALAGDSNLDGSTNLLDFDALKANFGGGARLAEGDFNGDRQVNLADFSLLKDNFGRADGPKQSDLVGLVAGVENVPEPATWLLALIAAGSVARFIRRPTNSNASRN